MTVKTPISIAAALLAVLAFSAAPALAEPVEAPVTEPATEITGTTATLHGELNPKASATTSYDFEYSPYGYCEVFPTKPEGPVTGEKLKVSAHVTELEAHTVYWFCAVALNGSDEPLFYAPALTFETLASAPVIPGESATNINAKDATLEGSVNPENRVTTYRFEYATEAAKLGTAEATTVGESAIPAVGEAQPVGPLDLGGVLEPSTTYFYRVVASNVTGVKDGTTKEFTTPALPAPAIDSESVTGVTQASAELHAMINPEYQETSFQFELGETSAYGLGPVPAAPANLGGAGFFGELGAPVNLGSPEEIALKPNTEYHYQVVATNGTGTSEGLTSAPGDATFLTLPNPPIASTGEEASAVTTSTATISGSVNPAASGFPAQDDTKYYFQYGTTTSYGHQVPGLLDQAEAQACRVDLEKGEVCPSESEAGEGQLAKVEQSNIAGLESDTTYHYRIVAVNLNDAGELNTNEESVYGGHLRPQVAYGQDETFTTPATPPVLSGVSVSGVSQSGATISATLEPNGLPTRWELQLGSTPGALGDQASGNTTSTIPLNLGVGSLTPGTTYYYKLTATNASGSVPPAEGSFTTSAGAGGSTNQSATGTLPAVIPFQSIAELNAKEAKEDKGLPGPVITKGLTRAQKLSKALKQCKKKKGAKRTTCEKQARGKYGAKKSKKK